MVNGRTNALDGRLLPFTSALRRGRRCGVRHHGRTMVDNGSVESVSLGDYIGVVSRRKWIVLIVTLLVAGAAGIYAKHQQTLYSSTSTVVYNPQAQSAISGSGNSKSGSVGVWGA